MRMSASLISISTSSALGQHRDGGGRGVDAALGLGGRHPLHAVDAALELQPAEHPLAADRGDDLLVAAGLAFRDALDLHPPAARCGVALVHAEEIAGEEGRLVAARAGAHLEDGRGVLVGVPRGEQQGQRSRSSSAGARRAPRGPRAPVRPSPRRRRVAIASRSSRSGARPLEPPDRLGDRPQLGVLLAQPHDLRPSAGRAHARLDLAKAIEHLFETGLGEMHGRELRTGTCSRT